MKKLAEKLLKIDIELPKWTREILYEHLIDVCRDLEVHFKVKNNKLAIEF
ncbi:MAG: hypothetical protein ACFE85_07525 [Candidatus Hodarchaeota archaeon]